jgi:GntR family transcriptional regulator
MSSPLSAFELKDLSALNMSSRLPLYAQLAEMLAERIRASQAKLAGKALPTELEIAAYFKISRPTVRQAMGQLLSEGLIERGRGRGTFIAPLLATRNFGRAFEFDILAPTQDVEFRLLTREKVTAPPEVCAALHLPLDEKVERITRLRLRKGERFGFENRYIPLPYARKITDKMLKQEAGIEFARYLIEGANGRVAFHVRAMPADAKIARLLNMKPGMALLSSEHTYFHPDDTPVLHGIILFRGDRYDFRFQAPVHGRPARPRKPG